MDMATDMSLSLVKYGYKDLVMYIVSAINMIRDSSEYSALCKHIDDYMCYDAYNSTYVCSKDTTPILLALSYAYRDTLYSSAKSILADYTRFCSTGRYSYSTTYNNEKDTSLYNKLCISMHGVNRILHLNKYDRYAC